MIAWPPRPLGLGQAVCSPARLQVIGDELDRIERDLEVARKAEDSTRVIALLDRKIALLSELERCAGMLRVPGV